MGEWISIEDRLPADNADVLAYVVLGEESRITAANVYKGVFFDAILDETIYGVTGTVTHWMPLPEPPGKQIRVVDHISYIRKHVTAPALYEQLAEESVELAHAALKMARYLRNENPTPRRKDEIVKNLVEELSDIRTVTLVLGHEPDSRIVDEKLERWNNRLMAMQGRDYLEML